MAIETEKNKPLMTRIRADQENHEILERHESEEECGGRSSMDGRKTARGSKQTACVLGFDRHRNPLRLRAFA